MAGKRKSKSNASASKQKTLKTQGKATANASILDFFGKDKTVEDLSSSPSFQNNSDVEQQLTDQDPISSFPTQTQMDDTVIDSLSINESYTLSQSSFQLIHELSDMDNQAQQPTRYSQQPWDTFPMSSFSSQTEGVATQRSVKTDAMNEPSQNDTQISQFTTDNSQMDTIIEDEVVEDDDNISIPSIPSISHEEQHDQQPVQITQPQFHFRNMIPSTPIPRMPVLSSLKQPEKVTQQLTNAKLIPGGYAEDTIKCILKEMYEYERWENAVNADMARYGSVVKLSRHDQSAVLFRMLDTWTEGGLIFSWCVLLPQEDIDFLLSFSSAPASLNEGSQLPPKSMSYCNSTQTESIKDFESQQIPRLPDYEPKEGEDETFLFAFSFAYMQNCPSPAAMEKFIKEEQVVGVWPDWKDVNMEVKGLGMSEVNLVTKFKADSIY